jgi:hypothetical protein
MRQFFPTNSKMPNTSSADATTHAASDLVYALQNPAPAAPFAQLGDQQMAAFRKLANIFATKVRLQTTTPATATGPHQPTPPRVNSPPPRVPQPVTPPEEHCSPPRVPRPQPPPRVQATPQRMTTTLLPPTRVLRLPQDKTETQRATRT